MGNMVRSLFPQSWTLATETASPSACNRSFDVSKQVIGQMFVHGVNVLISGIVAEIASGNACVLYFLNILIDTTFGTSRRYARLPHSEHNFAQAWQSYTLPYMLSHSS